jgi:2-amino-4-hydroxy-6-hydroxymethyldihydropteridine diphosphokinase
MVRVYLGLGTNLAEREQNLATALARLQERLRLVAVSSLYETAPWGVADQPPFLNAAVAIETDLSLAELLAFVKGMEREMGRQPSGRWGPRLIDIDILLYGDLVLQTPDLVIPHPRLAERAFVLVPLAEIAPDVVHPVYKQTIQVLLARAPGREGVRRWKRDWATPAILKRPHHDSPKAVIWDMDGVIADTAACHLQAWQRLWAEQGIEFTAEQFRRTFGQRTTEIIRGILGPDMPDEEVCALGERKEAYCRELLRRQLRALPGVRELLAALEQAGFRQALASSAPRKNVELILEALDIGRYFAAVVSEADVTLGKPDPQIFLVAAARLGIAPRRCLVIEDAVAGVQAAKAAGMRCLAVTTTNPGAHLAAADRVVPSLTEVSVADIEALLV